ncbi:MAG: hypothetical protein IJE74_04190 [Clostridia bacterium]|nr:hypothetical protein [Clostridia bacterium]
MEMWTIGFFAGIIAAVVIGVLVYITTKNQYKIKDIYDERQIKARGEAYKLSFIVAMLGFLLLLVFAFYADEKMLKLNFILPISIVAFVSLTVFGCACIWKDAWLKIYEKPKRTVASISVICALNYFIGISNYYNYCKMVAQDIKILDETAWFNMLNGQPYESTTYEIPAIQIYMPWINIICASVLLILIINYLIKLAVDKSREKREVNEES